MQAYIFPSSSTLHVQIAFERKLWAVHYIDQRHRAARRTKALTMPIGAYGLFYISSISAFAMPFIVQSVPEEREVTDVWPGTWYFPFQIEPLGFPSRTIPLKRAKKQWATLSEAWNPTTEIQMSGSMAFVPSIVADVDWDSIMRELC